VELVCLGEAACATLKENSRRSRISGALRRWRKHRAKAREEFGHHLQPALLCRSPETGCAPGLRKELQGARWGLPGCVQHGPVKPLAGDPEAMPCFSSSTRWRPACRRWGRAFLPLSVVGWPGPRLKLIARPNNPPTRRRACRGRRGLTRCDRLHQPWPLHRLSAYLWLCRQGHRKPVSHMSRTITILKESLASLSALASCGRGAFLAADFVGCQSAVIGACGSFTP